MPLFEQAPGETPIEDASGLKVKGITLKKELDLAEAHNILKATEKYLRDRPTREIAPFDYTWALRLHEEMFGEVWNWAGQLRQEDLNIGVPCIQIETRLYELFQNLPYWTNEPLLMQATMLHHGAVFIHPFKNGNGRWSRILANIWLRLHGEPFPIWPAAIGTTSPIRDEYLVAVKAGDEGDYEPLLELQKKFLVDNP